MSCSISRTSPSPWELASELVKTRRSMPPSRVMSASMVGPSIVIEVGRNMPCRTLRASKVSDAVGTVAMT